MKTVAFIVLGVGGLLLLSGVWDVKLGGLFTGKLVTTGDGSLLGSQAAGSGSTAGLRPPAFLGGGNITGPTAPHVGKPGIS